MIEKEIQLVSELGLHARPSLEEVLEHFKSERENLKLQQKEI